MFIMESKYEPIKIYAETIESDAIAQISQLANSPVGENAHIRIMPDAHAGAGCVIGTTMRITDKVCPNLVGVDIGCGVLAYQLENKFSDADIHLLDEYCEKNVVSGKNVRTDGAYTHCFNFKELACYSALTKRDRLDHSMGTLGGGNHFIELDYCDFDNTYWLVVHTGSRNLGQQVAKYYQKIAENTLLNQYEEERNEIIYQCKKNNHPELISSMLEKVQKLPATGLEFLTGQNLKDYLHDMDLCQQWAQDNRKAILDNIVYSLGYKVVDVIESIHNYIDIDNMILRKGSISAQKGERCIIPLNMRDGTMICVGKGNPDWNYSAPHGAGRILSRAAAKREINLEDFKESMQGIVSSSVCENTIDESPFAYKDSTEILEAVEDTVEVITVIKPVFNYKATE